MRVYITRLPALPNWQVKIRTQWYMGEYVAFTSIPVSTGMVSVNGRNANEHLAVHEAIDLVEELVNRIQYPYAGKLN